MRKSALCRKSGVYGALTNYGTVEYLVNELITVFVADSLIASHLIKQGISKRIDALEALVSRRKDELAKQGFVSGTLFASARSIFHERNKIAHNPYVIREKKINGKTSITGGIHVIRHHETGQKEEWIERARLEELAVASRVIVERFNELLGCSKVI